MDSDTRANLQASKSGIGLVASFALGVIGLAFSFTTLITSPLREQDARHTDLLDKQFNRSYEQVQERIDEARLIGAMEARYEEQQNRLDRLERLKDNP